jgi:oligopeptide transport system permease protein
MMNKDQMMNIPAEKFEFVQEEKKIYDTKLETKSISYMKDAMMRFGKNKSAVVAFALIIFLLLFAIIVPFFSKYDVTFRDGYYKTLLPKNSWCENLGFWDGRSNETKNQAGYDYLNAIG